MSHLDEGTLHALLDGELETHEVAEIQAHLGSCSSCGLRLREVKEFYAEADRLVGSLELPGAGAAAAAGASRSRAATLGLAKGAIGTTLARARRRLVEAYRAEERSRTKDRGKNVAS